MLSSIFADVRSGCDVIRHREGFASSPACNTGSPSKNFVTRLPLVYVYISAGAPAGTPRASRFLILAGGSEAFYNLHHRTVRSNELYGGGRLYLFNEESATAKS